MMATATLHTTEKKAVPVVAVEEAVAVEPAVASSPPLVATAAAARLCCPLWRLGRRCRRLDLQQLVALAWQRCLGKGTTCPVPRLGHWARHMPSPQAHCLVQTAMAL